MSLKLRKTASGRYALGVDIELGVDAAKPGRPKPGRPDGDEGMPDDDELEAGAEGEDEGEDEDERDLAKDDDKAGFAAKGFDDGDDEDDDAFAADDDSDDELSLAAEDDAAEDEDVDVVEDDVVEDDVELSLAAEDDNDDELSLAAEDDDDELSLAAEDDERAEDKDEDDEGSAPPRWPNRYPVRPGIQEVSQAPALFHDPDDDEDDDEDGDDTADAEPAPRAMARSARATPLAARAAPAKPAPAKPAPEKPAPEKPAPTKRTPAVALKKMLDAARKTIGMREYPPRSDHNKITQWYHNHIDKRIGDGAWCNMAVTYWAGHSGNLAAIFGGKRIGYAYTIYHAQKFQKKGRWHKGVAGIKPGDIVFYAWKGPLTVTNIDHVGIVEKVKGKKIVTIEGNSSDQCARRVRDSKYIVGYGRPIYGK
jgi:hypothetical protein